MAVDRESSTPSAPTATAEQPTTAVRVWVTPDFLQVDTAPEVTDYSFRLP
jgi:hypothetical protein